jgi:hypothetical protein
MGQNVREEMARMRERYSRTFNVPLETVEQEECVDAEGREYGRVQAPGLPEWTTGVLTRRPPLVRASQRSR